MRCSQRHKATQGGGRWAGAGRAVSNGSYVQVALFYFLRAVGLRYFSLNIHVCNRLGLLRLLEQNSVVCTVISISLAQCLTLVFYPHLILFCVSPSKCLQSKKGRLKVLNFSGEF